MNRRAEETATLSDGAVLPKGSLLAIPTAVMQSEDLYENAGFFIGDRFLELRNSTGEEHKHQLVATSPRHHFGFGHGTHACPGRFFVAIEMKVLLVYLLQKYNWKFTERRDRRPPTFYRGAKGIPDPNVGISFQLR